MKVVQVFAFSPGHVWMRMLCAVAAALAVRFYLGAPWWATVLVYLALVDRPRFAIVAEDGTPIRRFRDLIERGS